MLVLQETNINRVIGKNILKYLAGNSLEINVEDKIYENLAANKFKLQYFTDTNKSEEIRKTVLANIQNG